MPVLSDKKNNFVAHNNCTANILWLVFQEKNSITIIPATQTDVDIGLRSNESIENDYCIVHITGAVNNPGVYELPKGKRVIDAVKIAGNTKSNANPDAVNLATPIFDGQKIVIPYIIEGEETNLLLNSDTNISSQQYNYYKTDNLININNCTSWELEALDGIGPTLAQRIIDYRNKNGLFKKIEEIRNVPGIGEKKFNTIKEMITVY